MSYYIATTLDEPFETAIAHAEEALKKEGFGIISRIDIQDALKTKIGVEFRPYTILGACNPALAHEALKLEDKVGTMFRSRGRRRDGQVLENEIEGPLPD